ncbi:hypothetical protein FQN57_002037 [Myotisia sp. PD_48]|nr:hypothetical protein FQN57_002037 [Myotisia sp. PD_48]
MAVYTTDHSSSVLVTHGWRTASNSAAYLLPHITPTSKILDIGCGPGSISIGFAQRASKGHVTGIEYVADPLDQARELASSQGVANIEFAVGDIHSLDFPDNHFDIVHVHQVLQHIADPIQALREMRRVTKPGGIVAARESASMTWYPENAGINLWDVLMQKVGKAKGGNPNPGRFIHVWAEKAGFDKAKITKSAGAWCYSSPEERQYWGGSMAARAKASGFASMAVKEGFATEEELESIARGWWEFVDEEDAWFGVLHGVRHFKNFLSSIQCDDIPEDEKIKRIQILKDYCDHQFVKGDDGDPSVCFADLVQTWTFAESNNEESLLSLIPSVLAQFLKTVSVQLEFRDFAIDLCKYLLHKDNLKLFNRAFTASKSKEHVISPCLRLLTEIVSFDGGAVANTLYVKRAITMKRLDVFLVVRKSQEEEDKSTLRRNAQRYLLANLKFQNAAVKAEIIGQGKLIKSFVEDIRRDASDIVLEIIKTFDKHIIADTGLSRSTKSRLLNRWNLERLVTLYGYEKDSAEPVPDNKSVSSELHRFMLNVCTNNGKGVLLSENGWYPVGTSNPDLLLNDDDQTIPLGLDAPIHFDKFKEIPVRNGNLSALIQFLRPESDRRQMELILKIFECAPELVHDYFSKRTMFTSDPKPTEAWIGESSFLFSVIQLPVPEKCGLRESSPTVPPPVSVVIDSVMPRPFTQKVLTRCLNQQSDLITLFAIKTTTFALKKLRNVLNMFGSIGGPNQELWDQASGNLIREFQKRCPTMKDTIHAFRQTPNDDMLQREATLELLYMFYQVLPTVAFEEKFDVSLTLVEILARLESDNLTAQDRKLLFSQLQHVLNISHHSPSMRWWQKPESLGFSAFTSVLKVLIEEGGHGSEDQIKSLLQDILLQNSIIAKKGSFDAFIQSLSMAKEESGTLPWAYIDNCITRFAKRPVFYVDMADDLFKGNPDRGQFSLILMAVQEQWAYIIKANNTKNELATGIWISRFLACLKAFGEDEQVIKAICKAMAKETKTKESRVVLESSLKMKLGNVGQENHDHDTDVEMVDVALNETTTLARSADLPGTFGVVKLVDEANTGLHRWEREDLELAIAEGHIGNLILCLCSVHEEIRRQALAGLAKLMIKLQDSSYTERQSVYVLIGELSETVKTLDLGSAVPYIVAELAVRLLAILANPVHGLYGKVNKFLHKGPMWEIGKIPSYWIDKILYHEPENDDSHHEEIAWLLDLFVSGLRSEADMDIYRRAGVFERLLSLYSSPSLSSEQKKKILHLVFRVCEIGGSTTLLTRSAALSWVQGQIPWSDAQNKPILQALAVELYRTSSHEWVDRWSGSAVSKMVNGICGGV